MPDSNKRAWTKPVLTKFEGIDELRQHLEANATVDQVAAIEAMLDGLRRQQCSAPGHGQRANTATAVRRA